MRAPMRSLKPSLLARWAILGLLLAIGSSPGICFPDPNDIGYLGFEVYDGIVSSPPLQWSPDGQHIIFADSGEIYRVTSDGSDLQLILESEGSNEVSNSPRFSPDGTRIVYITTRHEVSEEDGFRRNYEIESSLVDGTDRRRLTESYRQDTNPVWSPDGSRIAFMKFGSGSWPRDYPGIYTMAADGSDQKLILPQEPIDFDVFPNTYSWTYWDLSAETQEHILRDTPDFDVLAIPKTLDWAYWDETSETFVPQQRVPNREMIASDEGIASGAADDLYLTTSFFYDAGAVWSPDGKKIAFTGTIEFTRYFYLAPDYPSGEVSGASIPRALYTVNADGSDLTPVFSPSTVGDDQTRTVYPLSTQLTWSPDGRRIAFLWYVDDYWLDNLAEHRHVVGSPGLGLYQIGADGSGFRKIADIDTKSRVTGALSWSPDGKSLLLSTIGFNRSGRLVEPNQIHVVRVDGSVPRLSALGLNASWSPDGSRIAVIGRYPPDTASYPADRLYTMAPDGTDIQVIVERDEDGELRAVNQVEKNCFLLLFC